MKIKLTLIAIVIIGLLGLGLANTIYAQGPDDGKPVTPCEFHSIMHGTEDCPFADMENWDPSQMMNNGECWYQQLDNQATMPFGGHGMMGGMMGMGSHQSMMGNGQPMHNMWNTNIETIETMPYFGMHQGMMNGWWSGNASANMEACPFWNSDTTETAE